MKKFDASTKKRIEKILKSKSSKILGITLGILLIIISVNLLLKSLGSNEKKISLTVSAPASPDLEKQEIVPPIYIKFRGSVSKIEDVQSEISSGVSIDPVDEDVKHIINLNKCK